MVLDIFGAVSLKRARDDNDDELEPAHQAKVKSQLSRPPQNFTDMITTATDSQPTFPSFADHHSHSSLLPEQAIEAQTTFHPDTDAGGFRGRELAPILNT